MLIPELGAVPGDGELDGVTVGEAVATLGLVDGPHAALELDHGPGVAAGQGGPGDLGSAVKRSIGSTTGFHNHGEGPH